MPLQTLVRELHTEIGPLTRQTKRRILRQAAKKRPVHCRRCPRFVLDPETAVFDNGHVSHRECAENINRLVDDMNDRMTRERLAESGFEIAEHRLERV